MKTNIIDEYVNFSKKSIHGYLKLILKQKFDVDVYDELINAYINSRYYHKGKYISRKFEVNIIYNLKNALIGMKDDNKYQKKAKYMFQMFKYILYFDNVLETDSVLKMIKQINKYRIEQLGISEENFENELYNMIKDNLTAKEEFLNSFDSKKFNINYIKVGYRIYDCILEHRIKFPKLYSDYSINKVFENKEISEQKLFVIYPIITKKILLDIIKGNFTKAYMVDYYTYLKEKPRKKKKLFNLIDNNIIKEKIIIKIPFNDYLNNKEEVYEFTRNGFNVALIIKDKENINREQIELLKLFKYVITPNEEIVNILKGHIKVLLIK